MLATHILLAIASESRTQSEVFMLHSIPYSPSTRHFLWQIIHSSTAVMYITLWPSQTRHITFAHMRQVPPPPRIWFPR